MLFVASGIGGQERLIMSFRYLPAISALALGVSTAFAQSSIKAPDAPPAIVETPLNSLNPVVVSAARIEQTLSDVIPSLTVITREEIERLGAPTLIDLIQGEVGVEVTRNGGLGTVSSIFLRGQNSVSAAVFIDGVRAQTDQIGTIKIIDIPLNMIERIEILRGNVGALYGEAAIGGVINIYTRAQTEGSRFSSGISTGSNRTNEVFAGISRSSAATRYQISVQKFKTDGFSAMRSSQNNAVNSDRDGFSRESIFARIEHDLSDRYSLGLSGNSIQSSVDYDSGFNTASDTHLLKTNSSDISLHSILRLSSRLKSNITLTKSELLYRDSKNASQLTEANGGRIEGHQNSLRVDNALTLQRGSFVFGGESISSNYSSRGTKHDRQLFGGYLGYSARIGRIDLQANARADEVSGRSGSAKATQSANTWLAGIGFLISDSVRLTSAMSTAFRAPATGELYGWGGNPNLKPEEHKSSEIGFSVSSSSGVLRLVRFSTDTRNAITYTNNTYINIGAVENSGVELNYIAKIKPMMVKFSAVSQDPRNAQTGARLSRRAKEYGSIDLSSAYGSHEFGGRLIISGDRIDGTNHLDPYTVLNLYFSKTLTREWKARFRIENAFDRDYQLVYGYNTPSRGIFAVLQYSPAY